MSREKQIEEMARELCDATQKTNQGCNSICYPRGRCAHCKVMAEHLYNAGYRKSTEVAEEIINEAIQVVNSLLNEIYLLDSLDDLKPYEQAMIRGERKGALLIIKRLAELKKKYTEEGK